jgi:hypothetical protein
MTVDHGEGARWFQPLADVDPPLAEHALSLLEDAGITAYAEPTVGESGPYRDIRPPDRPLTRLFVDSRNIGPAREILRAAFPPIRADFLADAAARADREAAALSQQDALDAAWDDIVAGYGPRPDVPETDPELTGPPLSSRLVRSRKDADDGPTDDDPVDYGSADRFEPPIPPPLPRPADRVAKAAWAGAIGGPVAVVAGWAFGLGSWVSGIGLVAFIAGFATLVARMKDRRDDDGNDGAVV